MSGKNPNGTVSTLTERLNRKDMKYHYLKSHKQLRSIKRFRRRYKQQTDKATTFKPTCTPAHHSVLIYEGEYARLCQDTLRYGDWRLETGGQLFGIETWNGTIIVTYVLGPGPDADHRTTFFRQDIPFLEQQGTRLIRTMKQRQVGQWHSHHHLGLTTPSSHDANNMLSNLNGMNRYLLCIATCNGNSAESTPYMFNPGGYDTWQWEIIPGESPVRTLFEAL